MRPQAGLLVVLLWVSLGVLDATVLYRQTPLDAALLSAAGEGDADKVRRLLASGADVNARGPFKTTPLHEACGRGTLETVRVLLAAGAELDAQDSRSGRLTPLGVIASTAKVEIARELISSGANVDGGSLTPLIRAAQWGRVKMIHVLVEAGAQVNPVGRRPPLHWARVPGSARALLELGARVDFRNDDGETALHRTAGHWSPGAEAVAVLIEAGSDVNARAKDGSTPLHRSIRDKKLAIVRQLIDAGASLEAKDKAGNTPMSLARMAGDQFVEVLRQAGARDDGRTPLQRAAERGEVEAMRKLLAAGSAVDERGPEGITALHLAAEAGCAPCVGLLLERGANPKATTVQEFSALHFAKTAEVAKLLIAAGTPLKPNERGDHSPFAPRSPSPLYVAAVNGRPEVVRCLLEHGADPYRPPPGILAWATFSGQLDVVEALLGYGVRPDVGWRTDSSALQVACIGGLGDVGSPPNVTSKLRSRLVLVLLHAGANPNKCRFHPPLHAAASSGQLEIVRFLLDSGAELNATVTTIEPGSLRGETALHGAASNGHLDVVQLLVKRGARVNAVTDSKHLRGRQTPLDLSDSADIRSYLLSRGGKVAAEVR